MNSINHSSSFTVLMAVYSKDDPHLFKIAIQSIFSNTVLPSLILVVADGPLTPELDQVLEDFSKEPIFSVIRCKFNQGLAMALNRGLQMINTKFTIRADSDDFNYPQRFQFLLSMLESGFDLVGSSILEVDKLGNSLAIKVPPRTHNEIVTFVKRRNPFNHMSVAFRTKVVTEAGGYPNIFLKEDYALWATLISKGVLTSNSEQILVRATTGQDFYKRRGGLRYAVAELTMQKHLVSSGIKNPLAGLYDGLLRALIFLAPGKLRELVYLNFLRQRVK